MQVARAGAGASARAGRELGGDAEPAVRLGERRAQVAVAGGDAARDAVGRARDHAVGHLVVVQHPAPAGGPARDVEAPARTGVQIHLVERLEAARA